MTSQAKKRQAPAVHERGEPYLDARAAAVHLGYRADSQDEEERRRELHAFYLSYLRHGIPVRRLGRRLLFRMVDLEAALSRVPDIPLRESTGSVRAARGRR